MDGMKIEDYWMTVKDLKEFIKDVDDDVIVVLSRDPEGNGCAPLSKNMFLGSYDSGEGEIGYKKLTSELIKEGFNENDIIENGIDCIAMFPVY